MLGQQSTFVSMVRCLAFVVLFLFKVDSLRAQTPRPPVEKSTEEIAAPVGMGAAASNTEVAPVKKAGEPGATELALKKTDELPTVEAKPAAQPQATPQCTDANTVKADVVALAQPIFLNRLGTVMPGGMVFALESDAAGAQLRRGQETAPARAACKCWRLHSDLAHEHDTGRQFQDHNDYPRILKPQKCRCTCRGWSGSQGRRTTAHSLVEIIPVSRRLRHRNSLRQRVRRGLRTNRLTRSTQKLKELISCTAWETRVPSAVTLRMDSLAR